MAGLQQYVWLDDSPSEFNTLSLDKLIIEVGEKVKAEYGSNALELRVATVPPLQADASQMELLFYHLLTNAVKFKKGDTAQVTVTATIIQQNRFRSLENKYKYEDCIKLDIRDEGIGFDPAFKQDIFELFKRGHYTEGRGLGLALCKKVVEKHSGTIEAQSKLSEYTIFTIILPLFQA